MKYKRETWYGANTTIHVSQAEAAYCGFNQELWASKFISLLRFLGVTLNDIFWIFHCKHLQMILTKDNSDCLVKIGGKLMTQANVSHTLNPVVHESHVTSATLTLDVHSYKKNEHS